MHLSVQVLLIHTEAVLCYHFSTSHTVNIGVQAKVNQISTRRWIQNYYGQAK